MFTDGCFCCVRLNIFIDMKVIKKIVDLQNELFTPARKERQ